MRNTSFQRSESTPQSTTVVFSAPTPHAPTGAPLPPHQHRVGRAQVGVEPGELEEAHEGEPARDCRELCDEAKLLRFALHVPEGERERERKEGRCLGSGSKGRGEFLDRACELDFGGMAGKVWHGTVRVNVTGIGGAVES